MSRAAQIVGRFLQAFQPCSDLKLEQALWSSYEMPAGTVRSARKRLEKLGLIKVAGRVGHGRRKRRTWELA